MGGRSTRRATRGREVVSEVGSELVRRSDAGQSPYVGNFHFHLLNDPKTINAFALPGGQIFITKALYEKLATEGELAGVLGHEIGHVVNRHSAQQMAKGQLGQLLTVAVGVGTSGDDGAARPRWPPMMANQMLQLKYGRNDESEADHYGLQYMAEAGYDPDCMLDVMKILKEACERRPPARDPLDPPPARDPDLEEIQDRSADEYPDGIPPSLSKGRALPHLRPSLTAR